jgi:hypothetical protein
MTHIEDGILRAYLDEELDAERQKGTTSHLATCDVCTTRLDHVQQTGATVSRRLALLDAPAPVRAAWPAVERRIKQAHRRRASPLARAAGLVLLLGGGAAAALLPGSPLRRADVNEVPVVAGSATPEAPTEAGIRPQASMDRVRFVVEAPTGTEVVVELVPHTSGLFADPSSSFSSAGEEIRAVVTEGPIRVEMSTRIADIRLEINGRDVVGVQSGQVVRAPTAAQRSLDPIQVRFRVR